jgi:DNA-binding response OmpR family regulator
VFRIFIVADDSEQIRGLRSGLAHKGFSCSVVPCNEKAVEQLRAERGNPPHLVLLDIVGARFDSKVLSLSRRIRSEVNIPLIGLVPREIIDNLDSDFSLDDLVVKPWNLDEVVVRIKRILRQTNDLDSKEIMKCGDLVIDSAKYEVSLGGEPIVLTFKEYQLLKFLASNKGKVFTRETLLAKVWGWDYYGGDRTVDVHIRRLRSKIEDRSHSFIDTLRNIGYRFKENV